MTVNLATIWEIHGSREAAGFPVGRTSSITPGQALTMEWGIGQALPLNKDQSILAQIGLVGYDQWQLTNNSGNFLLGRFTVPASRVPDYSVHGIGGQANLIFTKWDLLFFFKYYDEYSAVARPEGRTIVFGGSWTFGGPPKSAATSKDGPPETSMAK